ncbi:hypothetical protein RF11_10595 [Thelohanellus kitauei]|uniref:Uncharacterized protein n=1 Tax=Thelohanellus kitauei TaxID=669202 RepID=A0A0C2IV76_THEKT|nr:hypothetical protein RF11_10595 [Thelohanellus kitauei]
MQKEDFYGINNGWNIRGRGQVGYDDSAQGKFTCIRNKENGKITLLPNNGVYFEIVSDFDYCYRVDIIKNFYVARKDDVLKFGVWRNELIVMEHEDFFIRMIQHDAKVIFCTDIKI